MLLFHNAETSPNALKTKILLLELGIDYTQRDWTTEELRAGDFRETFPNAMIPAIEDDGLALAESGAIAYHLAGKHGKLLPKDLRSLALVHQAVAFEAALQAPIIGGMGIFGELGKPEAERDMARVQKLMPKAQQVAAVLSTVLGERDYFGGEFSIADIQLWAGATKAIQYEVFKAPPANLVAWDNRMRARPSVAEARQLYTRYRD